MIDFMGTFTNCNFGCAISVYVCIFGIILVYEGILRELSQQVEMVPCMREYSMLCMWGIPCCRIECLYVGVFHGVKLSACMQGYPMLSQAVCQRWAYMYKC